VTELPEPGVLGDARGEAEAGAAASLAMGASEAYTVASAGAEVLGVAPTGFLSGLRTVVADFVPFISSVLYVPLGCGLMFRPGRPVLDFGATMGELSILRLFWFVRLVGAARGAVVSDAAVEP
jgi:hypothetical protein